MARQECHHTRAGPGRTRLTYSPCPEAETPQSRDDGGNDCPETPQYLPTTPPTATGALLRWGCAWDGEHRGQRWGADDDQSFPCLFLDTWTPGNKAAGRTQEGSAAGQTQTSPTHLLAPYKTGPVTLSQRKKTTL